MVTENYKTILQKTLENLEEERISQNDYLIENTEIEQVLDYINSLKQKTKQLEQQLQNIRDEFSKYDWKDATQEQFYNQLKSLYESIFKGSESNDSN